jgi:hypothetical protein
MIASTSSLMPAEYRVGDLTAIIPLSICFGSHLIWPLVLDPYLTTFTVSLLAVTVGDPS